MKFLLFIFIILSSPVFALPAQIEPIFEKLVWVDPNEHRWGAYNEQGYLVRSGIASSGADWCEDVDRACHTKEGWFRVRSLGDANCKSPSFPIPTGGAPMPYCMYFNPYQALHGYPHVSKHENQSHGCVRLTVNDARWLRFNFVEVGTLVKIEPY